MQLLMSFLKWPVIVLLGTYLYKVGLGSNWFLLIIPVIGLTSFSIRKKGIAEFAFTKFFKKAIEKHFPHDSSDLLKEVDDRFKVISVDTQFASRSSNPIDRRLDFSA